jgi:hypothetical protein
MRRIEINWDDNPWFPGELKAERENDLRRSEECTMSRWVRIRPKPLI